MGFITFVAKLDWSIPQGPIAIDYG